MDTLLMACELYDYFPVCTRVSPFLKYSQQLQVALKWQEYEFTPNTI